MSAEVPPQNRYSRWFGTLACSIIAVVALSTGFSGSLPDQNTKQVWVFSAFIMSMIISGLAVLAHMVKHDFAGTTVEAGLAVFVLAVMICSLPIIMDPANGIAVMGNGGISNANLYFSSWGTFGMALSVVMHYLTFVSKVKGKNQKFRRGLWVALIATSVIALSSSVAIWQNYMCRQISATSRCNRLVFSITLSCISASISFLWVLCGDKCDGILDWILGMMMLISWSFGVAFLTFGREAPGSFLGNLYFSTWISFVVSCALASEGVNDIFASMRGDGGGDGGGGGTTAPKGNDEEDNNPRGGDEKEEEQDAPKGNDEEDNKPKGGDEKEEEQDAPTTAAAHTE